MVARPIVSNRTRLDFFSITTKHFLNFLTRIYQETGWYRIAAPLDLAVFGPPHARSVLDDIIIRGSCVILRTWTKSLIVSTPP